MYITPIWAVLGLAWAVIMLYCHKPEIARTAQIGVIHVYTVVKHCTQACKLPDMVNPVIYMNSCNMKISAISAYRQSPISAYRHIGKNVISARPYFGQGMQLIQFIKSRTFHNTFTFQLRSIQVLMHTTQTLLIWRKILHILSGAKLRPLFQRLCNIQQLVS